GSVAESGAGFTAYPVPHAGTGVAFAARSAGGGLEDDCGTSRGRTHDVVGGGASGGVSRAGGDAGAGRESASLNTGAGDCAFAHQGCPEGVDVSRSVDGHGGSDSPGGSDCAYSGV